jgi:hypothetical protein
MVTWCHPAGISRWWTLRRPFRLLAYHAATGCSPGPVPRWERIGRFMIAAHGGYRMARIQCR